MVAIDEEIAALAHKDVSELRKAWRRLYRSEPPPRLSRDLLTRAVAYKLQEREYGGLNKATKRKIARLAHGLVTDGHVTLDPGIRLKPGARLVREWRGVAHSVIVLDKGFDYHGRRYRSLSKIAREITGAPRFDPSLIRLIVMAHGLREKLLAGDGASLGEIAAREGMHRSYFTRVLRLAFLSPKITNAILDGHHPPDLNAARLMRTYGLPIEWQVQESALGFS
jgi:hypothetical protein